MEVSGQLHAPADLLTGKELPVGREWSPSWENENHSGSQEISHLLLNPKVH
jgi:hypothetical protein